MPWLESAAFTFLVPCGAIYDPPDRLGLSNLLSDLVQRGSGNRSSREFVEALERLGVDRSSSVMLTHTSYSGATLADNVLPAIELFADLIRRPVFPADQFDEARQVCFQELRAIEDDLAHRTMDRTRGLQFPAPWDRSVSGKSDHVAAMTMDDVQGLFKARYEPSDMIISVAGRIDWPQLRDKVESLFGDWSANPSPPINEVPSTTTEDHTDYDSQQTHIGIAYPSVKHGHKDYYQARGAVGVLSEGMSSRLFTEVREKEGLCYTVFAAFAPQRDRGAVFCYAASGTDTAQETLDITLRELRRMKDGVTEAELNRVKAKIKSLLIMQQESSVARSVSMANDWYYLKRIRPMQEIADAMSGLTAESISDYLRRDPPTEFRVATLGKESLRISGT